MGKDRIEEERKKKSRGITSGSRGNADWATIDSQLVVRAIAAASITGGCLRCGYTRDGGAYAVGIYGDGDVYTEFANDHASCEELLRKIIELFDDIRTDSK